MSLVAASRYNDEDLSLSKLGLKFSIRYQSERYIYRAFGQLRRRYNLTVAGRVRNRTFVHFGQQQEQFVLLVLHFSWHFDNDLSSACLLLEILWRCVA